MVAVALKLPSLRLAEYRLRTRRTASGSRTDFYFGSKETLPRSPHARQWRSKMALIGRRHGSVDTKQQLDDGLLTRRRQEEARHPRAGASLPVGGHPLCVPRDTAITSR
jgi:hypothetical protein